MSSDEKNINEQIINGQKSSLNLKSEDSDKVYDLQELMDTVQLIDTYQEGERESASMRARCLSEYVINDIKQLENSGNELRQSEIEQVSILRKVIEKRNELEENVFKWFIIKFDLLPSSRKKPRQYNGPRKRKPPFVLRPVVYFLLLISIVTLSVYIENTDVGHIDDGADFGLVQAGGEAELIQYSGDVKIALAGNTRFYSLSSNIIEMEAGDIWLDVNPGGKGFRVLGDVADVTVTGTQFGVEQNEGVMKVKVLEGSVEIEVFSIGKIKVTQGQMIYIERDKEPVLEDLGEGAVPAWLRDIAESDDGVFVVGRDALMHRFNFGSNSLRDSGFGNSLSFELVGGEGLPFSEIINFVGDKNGSVKDDVLRIRKSEQGQQVYKANNFEQLGDDYTFSFWVRTDDLAQEDLSTVVALSSVQKNLQSNFDLWVQFQIMDGKYALNIRNSHIPAQKSKMIELSEIVDDEWQHFTVKNEGSEIVIYHNGVLLQKVEFESTSKIKQLQFGQSWKTQQGFSGEIDDFRFYNRALKDWEIEFLAK